ncbi:hypothetical protein HHL22_05295 [Hymenobacter sp. RP-2-7]|uniref:DUF3098 domain-containing protein n=1 Tax=Hymenobacter polaris TaxID=2682546 RepID=A0A7Y0AC39_9BACT|nr:hypothetical protein [Hymenobacter polaris]NML64616.1 hypothetical protein [Hymenobacter polaris]
MLGILLIFAGWLAGGIGYGEPVGPPWNTILFLAVIPLIISGILLLFKQTEPDVHVNKKAR